jgi:PAS domain S-box-containing protein
VLSRTTTSPFSTAARKWSAPLVAPLGLAIAYYAGARIGFLLTPREQPVSTLWPPNAIVLAALLLTPPRRWPVLIAAVFPAHLAIELRTGVPIPMVLCWFVSNATEALVGAIGVRSLSRPPIRLDTLRRVNVFVACAALGAPFLSSFVDAGFVALNHFGSRGYWDVWRARFFANTLSALALVPVIIAISRIRSRERRGVSALRALEGTVLGASLLVVCTVVFTMPMAIHDVPPLLYTPLPFLLWAAVRFGPGGVSAGLLLFAFSSIWGAIHGHGPFIGYSPEENVLSLQLFLIVTYIPLLALTAVLRERKRTAEEARRNEQRLNLALGAANVATWDWPVGIDSDGYRRFIAGVHGEDRAIVEAAIARALAETDSYEIEFRRATSPVRWELCKGCVVREESGVPTRMIGITADVTERKQAEAALLRESMLRESAAQLRELANAMPQIVFTARSDGRIDFINRKWYELTQTPEGPIDNETVLGVIHADERDGCLTLWNANIRFGRPHEHEARFRSGPSGIYRWHLVRALPARDADGTIRRWYATATDIDDRKRAEDALRESEAQLRLLGEQLEHRVADRTSELSRANATLRKEIDMRVRSEKALRSSEERFFKAFRASPDAICIAGRDGRIHEANERWEEMFGYTRAEVLGKTAAELGIEMTDVDLARLSAMMSRSGSIRDVEVDLRNRAGESLRAVMVCEAVEVDGESCFITMVRDITERRRAEQMIAVQRNQLAHLGRVAVLGELSGAIAHELNQPLTAILANARAAQRLMSRPSCDLREIREILGDIANDDLRAAAVIRRMRDLIRNGESTPQITNVNDVVREVLELANGDLLLREVSVSVRLSPALPCVPVDRVQLQQVLLNLIVNACDAMAENARGDRLVVVASSTDGAAVRLSVCDHGGGIRTDPIEAVFEPFRTTKEHGLGLGLSICKSIVAAHGGKMWAMNNGDRGATFHLALPIERERLQ